MVGGAVAVGNPEESYGTQLTQLADMGFYDRQVKKRPQPNVMLLVVQSAALVVDVMSRGGDVLELLRAWHLNANLKLWLVLCTG